MFICLPPNSTHLTQPLEVALFGPLKNHWKQILLDYQYKNPDASAVNKPKFPYMLSKLLHQMKNTVNANIKSGFRTCGIVPVNREVVKAKLQLRQVPEPVENSEVVSFFQQQRGSEPPSASQLESSPLSACSKGLEPPTASQLESAPLSACSKGQEPPSSSQLKSVPESSYSNEETTFAAVTRSTLQDPRYVKTKSWEGDRKKGQREGSVSPPVVVPTSRPLRGRWV